MQGVLRRFDNAAVDALQIASHQSLFLKEVGLPERYTTTSMSSLPPLEAYVPGSGEQIRRWRVLQQTPLEDQVDYLCLVVPEAEVHIFVSDSNGKYNTLFCNSSVVQYAEMLIRFHHYNQLKRVEYDRLEELNQVVIGALKGALQTSVIDADTVNDQMDEIYERVDEYKDDMIKEFAAIDARAIMDGTYWFYNCVGFDTI